MTPTSIDPTTQPERLPAAGLTLTVAARYLGVSLKTLRRWGDQGAVTIVRAEHRRPRVPKAELVRLINGHRQPDEAA